MQENTTPTTKAGEDLPATPPITRKDLQHFLDDALTRHADTGDFTRLNCSGWEFERDINLESMYVGGVDFTGTVLTGASFHSADLSSVVFKETDLRDTDFFFAKVSYSSFEDADLTGADFRYATLKGVDLRGANLTGAQFSGTVFDSVTWDGLQVQWDDCRVLHYPVPSGRWHTTLDGLPGSYRQGWKSAKDARWRALVEFLLEFERANEDSLRHVVQLHSPRPRRRNGGER